MSLKKNYTYYAFISYSSKDKRLAYLIHKTLQRFNLPVKLQKQEEYKDKPKNIRPIFRDKENLEIGELSEVIKKNLAVSKYLIVICSQNSAVPNDRGKHWVNEEIKGFLQQPDFPERRIIPILYRPILHTIFRNKRFLKAQASEEKKTGLNWWQRLRRRFSRPASRACFPPALAELKTLTETLEEKSHQILAADVQESGLHRAIVKVIARMLDVNPDALWDTYGRYLRRMQVMRTFLWILFVTGCVLAYDYYVPKVEYYTHYVERNNAPEGFNKLKPEQVQHREHSYKITKQYWKVQKVEHVDFMGKLVTKKKPWGYESARIVYTHDAGTAPTATHFDEDEKIISVRRFESLNLTYFVDKSTGNTLGSSFTRFFNDKPHITGGRVQSMKIERDVDGYVIAEHYQTPSGLPCMSPDDVWGTKYTLHPVHKAPEVVQYIDRDGKPMNNNNGICSINIKYNENAYPVSVSFKNKEGDPVPYHDDVYSIEYHYENDNLQYIQYLNAKGNLVYNPKEGYAKITIDSDYKKHTFTTTYYDENKNNMRYIDGSYAKKIEVSKNGNTLQVVETFLQPSEDGKTFIPMMNEEGIASIIHSYNIPEKEKKIYYRGIDNDKSIKETSLKIQQKTEGVTRYIVHQKDIDNIKSVTHVKRENFDSMSRLVWEEEYEYDNGDENSKRVGNYAPIPKTSLIYDDNETGGATRYEFYDIDNQLISRGDIEYHHYKDGTILTKLYRYDNNLNLNEIRCQERDPLNRTAIVECIKPDDKQLVPNLIPNSSVARAKIKWGESGKGKKVRFFDSQKSPCGFSYTTPYIYGFEYEYHPKIEIAWFLNKEGNKIVEKNHIAGIKRVFNNRRKIISVAAIDCEKNYIPQLIDNIYDNNINADNINSDVIDLKISDTYVTPDAPFSHCVFEYDDYGRKKIERYFNPDNTPCKITGKNIPVYGYEYEYGNGITTSWLLDKDGKRFNERNQIAGIRKKYDSSGRVTATESIDCDGHLVQGVFDIISEQTSQHEQKSTPLNEKNLSLIASRIRKYDKRGSICEEQYLNAEEKLCEGPDGYARRTTQPLKQNEANSLSCSATRRIIIYNKQGNIYSEFYTDEKYKLTNGPEGWAQKIIGYKDGTDLVTKIVYLSEDKIFCKGPEGWAVKRISYKDGTDLVTRIDYLNEDRILCKGPEGWAVKLIEYKDGTDLVTLISYHNEDGTLCKGPEGYARVERQYDDQGNMLGEAYSTEENIKRDDKGRVTEITYTNAQGNRVALPNGCYRVVNKYNDLYNYQSYIRSIISGEEGVSPEETYSKGATNYAGHICEYDKKGNLISERYVDGGKKLCKGPEGWAEKRIEYKDGTDLVTSIGYLNEVEKLCKGPEGWAQKLIIYKDGTDLVTKIVYLNEDWILCKGPEGWAGKLIEYKDGTDLVTRMGYYNKVEKLCKGPEGWAKKLIEYKDGTDLVTLIGYLNKDGILCKGPEGWAVKRIEYKDGTDLVTSIDYLNEDGTRCKGPEGWAEKLISYKDGTDLVTRMIYLNEDGIFCKGPEGYALVERQYDDQGNMLGEAYSTEENIKRDDKGMILEITYIDKDGNRSALPDGTYRTVPVFNEHDTASQMERYNEKGELIKVEKY